MENNKTLTLVFGALQPKIATQLKKQKFGFDKDYVDLFEKHKESITYLMFGGYLSDKLVDKMYDKLRAKIVAHVKKHNKLTNSK